MGAQFFHYSVSTLNSLRSVEMLGRPALRLFRVRRSRIRHFKMLAS
jgi:hypothetical protein